MKKRLVLGLILLAVLLTLFIIPYKGSPTYEGSLSIKGFHKNVIVDYDNNGIPHIEAENEEDAYRALGFVMAQDRLLQMDLIRRLSSGRLAELIGPKAIASDKLFRSLSLNHAYRGTSDSRDPHIEKLMKGFVEGVNAYIDEGQRPYEYLLLGAGPSYFTIEDGHFVLGYMAYSFAMGFKTDFFFESLKSNLKEAEQLKNYPQRVLEEVGLKNSLWRQGHDFAQDYLGLFTGSNAWALRGHRTKSKAPMLASDPHVRFTSPGLWYEAHLKYPGFEFYGHFVPGVPFAAMGHTQDHGWGVTISYIDDMDFIWEDIEHGQVVSKDRNTPIKTHEEIIKVKGQLPIKWPVAWGPRGPLVANVLADALKNPKLAQGVKQAEKNHEISLKWGHHALDNSAVKTLYYGLKAKNSQEFERAMGFAGAPGLNIIYVNKKEDLIARYLVGTVWERLGVNERRLSQGRFLESDSNNHWKVIPFEERPHLKNPDSGVVVSANQIPEDVPSNFPGYFHPADRHETIHHLLRANERWDLEEMKLIQTASVNVKLLEHMKRILDLFDTHDDWHKNLKNYLSDWKGVSDRHSGEALFYFKVIENFRRKAFPELSDEQFDHYCGINDFSFALFRRLQQDKFEGAIVKSIGESISQLKKEYGEDFRSWNLGSEHLLTFPHPLGRASKALAMIFNHGPFPVDGGFHQINHMREIGCKSGLKVEAGPSTRRLVDFADASESWGILPMGNSGHRKSPFLFDQWQRFQANEYRPQLMRKLTEKERYGRLLIKTKSKGKL